MSDEAQSKVEQSRQLILDAKQKGTGATLLAYTKLSGPGWLQSAITLGGGSLGGSLYLGMIAGYDLLWLQPIMMILGVVMLSAIGYVALSTSERPFRAINKHINPVLGWGWVIATLMANMVWAMPQFALGTAAMQQNLGLFGGENGAEICAAILFVIGAGAVFFYDGGGLGVKIFDWALKLMVAVVVISFFGVVVAMTAEGSLEWGKIAAGFVPDLSLLSRIPSAYGDFLRESAIAEYWDKAILDDQRGRMVTAAATAVGINMTFLLPYSMLKRGWDRDFRGLATFDLSTGLFIPFVVATSCVVIASATQFHAKPDKGLLGQAEPTAATAKMQGGFEANLQKVLDHTKSDVKLAALEGDAKKEAIAAIPLADRKIAAMLVSPDAGTLALSLEGLTGKGVAQIVFGIGVLGMAVSTIIILMLINGFTICEMLGQESKGALYRFGSILPGLTGGIGALTLWTGQAKFYVVQPTSSFGMMLLPIAYVTFFLMINSKSLLGDNRPEGGKRLLANLVMLLALVAATIGSGWVLWSKFKALNSDFSDMKNITNWVIVGTMVVFVALAVIVQVTRKKPEDA